MSRTIAVQNGSEKAAAATIPRGSPAGSLARFRPGTARTAGPTGRQAEVVARTRAPDPATAGLPAATAGNAVRPGARPPRPWGAFPAVSLLLVCNSPGIIAAFRKS